MFFLQPFDFFWHASFQSYISSVYSDMIDLAYRSGIGTSQRPTSFHFDCPPDTRLSMLKRVTVSRYSALWLCPQQL